MKQVFLDFDGVIIDSIAETYEVSKKACQALQIPVYKDDLAHPLFWQYRGLVGPPWEFLALHSTITQVLRGDCAAVAFDIAFQKATKGLSSSTARRFIEAFFFARKELQNDLPYWLSLNPLTAFGKVLHDMSFPHYTIVTTKDRKSVELCLQHYRIEVGKVLDLTHYQKYGSKGRVIQKILGSKSSSDYLFVDDAVQHLDSVNDPRVSCFFADWGYGKNSDYPPYDQSRWGE